jgi:Urease alpha-subunit, N-terminal domain
VRGSAFRDDIRHFGVGQHEQAEQDQRGHEGRFGGGKVIRESMGQADDGTGHPVLDLVITNAVGPASPTPLVAYWESGSPKKIEWGKRARDMIADLLGFDVEEAMTGHSRATISAIEPMPSPGTIHTLVLCAVWR